MNKLIFATFAALALCCVVLQASAENVETVGDVAQFETGVDAKSSEVLTSIEALDMSLEEETDAEDDLAEKAAGGKKKRKSSKKGKKKSSKKGKKSSKKGKKSSKKGKKGGKKGGKKN